jgi:hypothetical protein
VLLLAALAELVLLAAALVLAAAALAAVLGLCAPVWILLLGPCAFSCCTSCWSKAARPPVNAVLLDDALLVPDAAAPVGLLTLSG